MWEHGSSLFQDVKTDDGKMCACTNWASTFNNFKNLSAFELDACQLKK